MGSDLSTPTVDIVDAVVNFIMTVIHAVILCYLLSKFKEEEEKIKSSWTRISVISYFTFNIIYSLSEVINYLSKFMLDTQSTDDSHDDTYNVVYYTTYIICGFANYFYDMSFAIFLKMRLQSTYKNTYWKVNKRFMNVLLIIFSISEIIFKISEASYYGLSYWYDVLQSDKHQIYNNIATLQYFIINVIYLIIILYLFNIKLYKFISDSMTNDTRLTMVVNQRLNHQITKQTNLICIIAILTVLYWLIYGVYWNYDPISNNSTHVGYILTKCFYFWAKAVYLYLTFKFNDKNYSLWCKYTHRFCNIICQKLFYKLNKDDDEISVGLLARDGGRVGFLINDALFINDKIEDTEELCDGAECAVINRMCTLLNKYQTNDLCDGINTTDILNDFNHILDRHDSDKQFNQIYNKLDKHCDRTDCKYYKRYYRRRGSRNRANDEEETKYDESEVINDIMVIFMDKIHSFYQHSYDTSLRRRSDEKSNEDDIITTTSVNNESVNNNKFSSNLSLNGDDNNINYSFGQRFKYEKDGNSNNQWLVKPKYDDIKDELLNNAIWPINIDIYNIEYSICIEKMKTKCVRRVENRKLSDIKIDLLNEHILSLLVYCDCDIYQNKWSATFRRNSSNETDISLKQRHSNFYFSSLYLTELIEYFGSKLIDDNNINKKFYHGVSQILYFDRTTTQFNCPLSTSEEVAVAQNFTNNVGIVLELQYSFSTYPLYARYFECLYFSKYVNEKECLFIGGVPIMIIKNIFNVNNNEQYRKYINSLNIINCLMNGIHTDNNNNYKVDKQSIDLCVELLFYRLSQQQDNKDNANDDNWNFPHYVANLVNKYSINLKYVMIFWQNIEKIEKLMQLIGLNEDIPFFNLDVLLTIFPSIEQIEYFNENINKKDVKKIINYVVNEGSNKINNNLKYIIIHHQISYKLNSNIWCIRTESERTVLYKKILMDSFDINQLNFRFNQINQGHATKTMLHLLQ